MSVGLDELLRGLVEDVVRRIVREELAPIRTARENAADTFMTIAEVARLVSVTANTVRSWIAKGLPTHGNGRVVRIRRSELDQFLNEHDTEAELDHDEHAAEILARRERR